MLTVKKDHYNCIQDLLIFSAQKIWSSSFLLAVFFISIRTTSFQPYHSHLESCKHVWHYIPLWTVVLENEASKEYAVFVLYSHIILICRCMQKHIQHNKDEWTQFFRKIYLSLYLKGLRKVLLCERWVGDWTELQYIDPPTLLAPAAFLFRSSGMLNRGPGGPASAGTWFSLQHLLSNWSELPVAGII